MTSQNSNSPIPLNTNQQSSHNVINKKPSQDQRLVELTKEFQLYRDEKKVGYIEIIYRDQGFRETGRNIIRIKSEDFKEYINNLFYRNYYQFAQKNALESYVSHLNFEAKDHGKKVEIFNRLGIDSDENIYIDLANGTDEIVKVSRSGWNVGKYPVLFARYGHTAPLQNPQSGGNLKDLMQFIQVRNRHEECLLLCWLVASLIPDIERCFLLLEGPPGSRKTTIANRLKSLIDPMKGDALVLPSKKDEVAQQIGQHCIPFFDNITSISTDISNMFCLCFGEAVHSKRALFTDDGTVVFSLTGNMIFTSIKLARPRPDFLQRIFKIATVKKQGFMSTRKLNKRFNGMAPQLFGALLDTLVKVLNIFDQFPDSGRYRTVDFDQYCAAAAEVLGYGQQTFWEAREHTEEIKQKGMVKAFPVIQALETFLESCGGYWIGCMTELLNRLKAFSSTPEQLPKAATSLSNAINTTLSAEIDAAGIQITPVPGDNCNHYEITLQDPVNLNQNNNVVFPPPQSNSTVVEALEQVISEQIEGISELSVNEPEPSGCNSIQQQEPISQRSGQSNGDGESDSLKDDSSLGDEMNLAVNDLFNSLAGAKVVGPNENPFLIDDTPADEK